MDPAPRHPPDIALDIAEPCAQWRRRRPDIDALCADSVRAALAAAPALPRGAELSLVLADDATVRELNRAWRGMDRPTNVLSFPAQELTPGGPPPDAPPDAPWPLGDVVLACETVAGEAAAQGKDFADHLRHLVVHGVLHLLGHEHEDNAEAERMEGLERRILAGLGVADPYRERTADPRDAAHG
jgi:probable rRNA maturation factor